MNDRIKIHVDSIIYDESYILLGKEQPQTYCTFFYDFRYQGKQIVYRMRLSATGVCSKTKDDKYDKIYAKKLANAKAQLIICQRLFDFIQKYTPYEFIEKFEIKTDDIIKVIYNTSEYAKKMIKHQKQYLHKLYKN